MRMRGIIMAGVMVWAATLCVASAFAAPTVYVGTQATPVEKNAAVDVQRCLYLATGSRYALESVESLPAGAEGVVIGSAESLPKMATAWPFGQELPGEDGYILHAEGGNKLIIAAGATAVGARNGAYALLEELGFGFYLGGQTNPSKTVDIKAIASQRLNVSVTPVFAVRGTLCRYNYLAGPAAWEFEDYRAYIDELARMRCNLVVFGAGEPSPVTAKSENTAYPLPTSATAAWGMTPLESERFFAGTGAYFAGKAFGAGSSPSPIADRIPSAHEALAKALMYAKARGLKTGLGLAVPGDPFDPKVQEAIEATIAQMLQSFAALDTIWLWEPDGAALNPPLAPAPRGEWAAYVARWDKQFAGLADASRRAEAVRLAAMAQYARQIVKANRPDVELVVSGPGGDAWQQCTDFYPGMDGILAKDVAFSALDNPKMTPTVSAAYGQLAADRQRWPILWLEYDGDLWAPQPNLAALAGACADARAKGCQGLIGAHWRTRDAEEAAAFCAKYAWDPQLTLETFCAQRAQHLFGATLGPDLAPYLVRLQALGYRWMGGAGQGEAGPFAWQPADDAKRAELAQIAFELRAKAQAKGLKDALPELTDIVPDVVPEITAIKDGIKTVQEGVTGGILGIKKELERGLKTVVPGVKQLTDIRDTIKQQLLAGGVSPESFTAVVDLLHRIEYLFAYDTASRLLGPNGGLDELVAADKKVAALALVQQSKLPKALHAYARGIANKGELGVLATMNTKAWANLRARLGVDDETLTLLEQAVQGLPAEPGLLVLPDRVIVVGVPAEGLTVKIRARALGDGKFEEQALTCIGGATFAMAFPKALENAANIEYGIEAQAKGQPKLVWPAAYPERLMTCSRMEAPAIAPATAPAPAKLGATLQASLKIQVDPAIGACTLAWDAQDGEIYAIARDGAALGAVADGCFVDYTAPGAKEATYTVAARALDKKVEAQAKQRIDAFQPPKPPAAIAIGTRGGRAVIEWASDDPLAAEYLVTRYDAAGKPAGEIKVPADPGQRLSCSDSVKAGEAYAYSVTPVAADGTRGAASKQTGVIASADPLRGVEVLMDAPNFLDGLAQLSKMGVVLGGQGGAELAKQPDWEKSYPLTVSLWIQPSDLAGMPVPICKGAWEKPAYYIQVVDGHFRFALAGVDTLDGGQATPGQWAMVTATYSAEQMRLYVNGELVARKQAQGKPCPAPNAQELARYAQNPEIYAVRGMLDDIRVYDAALAPQEVAELFTATKDARK